MSGPSLREWLREEPFTLSLSAGFFGFFAHCGMLSVLEDEGLLPRRLCGASAGGLVAGAWAGGVSSEVFRDRLFSLQRRDFWDPSPGFGLLRGRLFDRLLREMLVAQRFEDCRAELAVSVFDVWTRTTRVVNDGDLANGIRATCALPFLFLPVWLRGRPVLDGGVLDRPGHAPLRVGERVFFHHLASRSPWRRRNSPVMQIPRFNGMVTMAVGEVERVSPFKLENGRKAYEQVRVATREGLDRLVGDGAILV